MKKKKKNFKLFFANLNKNKDIEMNFCPCLIGNNHHCSFDILWVDNNNKNHNYCCLELEK